MFKILSFLFIFAILNQIDVLKMMLLYGLHFIIAVIIETVIQQLFSLDIKLFKLKYKVKHYVQNFWYNWGENHALVKGRKNKSKQRQRKNRSDNRKKQNITLNEKSSTFRVREPSLVTKMTEIEKNQVKDFYQFIRVPVQLNCYREYFCCCRMCRLNMLEFCIKKRCLQCTPPVLTYQRY